MIAVVSAIAQNPMKPPFLLVKVNGCMKTVDNWKTPGIKTMVANM